MWLGGRTPEMAAGPKLRAGLMLQPSRGTAARWLTNTAKPMACKDACVPVHQLSAVQTGCALDLSRWQTQVLSEALASSLQGVLLSTQPGRQAARRASSTGLAPAAPQASSKIGRRTSLQPTSLGAEDGRTRGARMGMWLVLCPLSWSAPRVDVSSLAEE